MHEVTTASFPKAFFPGGKSFRCGSSFRPCMLVAFLCKFHEKLGCRVLLLQSASNGDVAGACHVDIVRCLSWSCFRLNDQIAMWQFDALHRECGGNCLTDNLYNSIRMPAVSQT